MTSYYDGGFKIIRDGIPCRVAAHVAAWSEQAKEELHRPKGYLTDRQKLRMGIVTPRNRHSDVP